jgi:predicted secreted protein
MAGTRTIGSTLTLVKAGAEPTDTVLAALTSIGETGGEHEEVDVTTLDSPGGAKEFIAGATDYGSFDVVGNVIDGEQQSQLYTLFKSRAVREWQISIRHIAGSRGLHVGVQVGRKDCGWSGQLHGNLACERRAYLHPW